MTSIFGLPQTGQRSEEHTSELQSRRDLVCRLLPEKKKTSRSRWISSRHTVSSVRTERARTRCSNRSAALRVRPSARCFFFNDTATTEIYTLSLHDALPI